MAGSIVGDQASISTLSCLGTYINPISVMIYAYTISTMTFKKKNIQALFLGWALFLTPAVMTYSSFTHEHIMLYSVAASVGIAGAILYKKCIPYICYFVMSIVYLICKYFMLYYSEEMLILTSKSWVGKIGQFFACEQMDIILILVLLLILLGFKEINTEKENLELKKDLIYVGIIAGLLLISIISNKAVDVHAIKLHKVETNYLIAKDDSSNNDADTTESTSQEMKRKLQMERHGMKFI